MPGTASARQINRDKKAMKRRYDTASSAMKMGFFTRARLSRFREFAALYRPPQLDEARQSYASTLRQASSVRFAAFRVPDILPNPTSRGRFSTRPYKPRA